MEMDKVGINLEYVFDSGIKAREATITTCDGYPKIVFLILSVTRQSPN